jgi:nucleoside-diphosphate-sugar epimerase
VNILIIGGTGHIGSYLVPRLLEKGMQITILSREAKPKYPIKIDLWDKVVWIKCDIRNSEKTGTLPILLAKIDCDIVVDLISFTPEQNEILVQAFSGRIKQFLFCGSIWSYGPSHRVPHLEEYSSNPISQYGIDKDIISKSLINKHKELGFPATILHPGHISSKYWTPIDPRGSLDPTAVYQKIAMGKEIILPERGAVPLHHVHADDVAQLFELAILNPHKSIGQIFSAVSPYAQTMLASAEFVAGYFRKKLFYTLCLLQDLKNDKFYETIKSHIEESVVASCRKAEKILGFCPNFSIEDIYTEYLDYITGGNGAPLIHLS